MKKLLSSIFSTIFFISSASASTLTGFEQIFNELEYSLKVEWDQHDQNFKNQVLKKFELDLKELKETGVTNAEMVESVLAKLDNQKIASEIKTNYDLLDKGIISQQEFESTLSESLAKSRSQGANFIAADDETIWFIGVTGIGVLVLMLMVARSSNAQNTNDVQ